MVLIKKEFYRQTLTVTFCVGAAGFKNQVLVLNAYFINLSSSQWEIMKETFIINLKFINTSAMEMHMFSQNKTVKKYLKLYIVFLQSNA